MRRFGRRILLVLLIVNGLLLPMSCLQVLYAVNAFGMGPVFVTSFEVDNGTAGPIRVTPIGTAGDSKRPLPTMLLRYPAVDAARRGGYHVAPGRSVRIFYDWDDVQLTELVIEREIGQAGQIVVGTYQEGQPYTPPKQQVYVVDEKTRIEPLDAHVQAAWQAALRPSYRL